MSIVTYLASFSNFFASFLRSESVCPNVEYLAFALAVDLTSDNEDSCKDRWEKEEISN